MKAAAFNGVPNLKNYDLESSHVNGLIQQFEIAGRDTVWLVEYRDTPNSKAGYAERAGMSVECWKKCLLALCMGARLPNSFNDLDEGKGDILANIREECGGDINQMIAVIDKFRTTIMPLAKELSKWHSWLVKDKPGGYFYAIKKPGRGGWYIENAMRRKLNMTTHLAKYSLWKVKAKVASFVLTDQEAAFIHTLTVLGAKHGYKVIGNEHDGVITIKAIGVEAVEEAARLSGLQNARLIEKPFPTRSVADLA